LIYTKALGALKHTLQLGDMCDNWCDRTHVPVSLLGIDLSHLEEYRFVNIIRIGNAVEIGIKQVHDLIMLLVDID
jgi:hypothetical protein